MSSESLRGDRDSLERMVIEFAQDNPDASTGLPLTDAQISVIGAKVREGDLTPILRAYEVCPFCDVLVLRGRQYVVRLGELE